MKKNIKDIGKSIRTKLLNIAKTKNVDFQQLAIRYLYERLLYRLSISKYRDKLYLKGGVLMYAIEQNYARPTLDIDFLGDQMSNDMSELVKVFAEICAIDDPEDGVVFDFADITAEPINEAKDYVGTRLSIVATLDTIKQPLKIDIGFGDVLVAEPKIITYQPEINTLKAPKIKAYSIETVIAEKFQAMIDLSELNSRLKDFYDVYGLLTKHDINQELLSSSILATFKNRGTGYIENHPLFTPEFASDAKRLTQWKAVLRKQKKNMDLDFEHVLKRIEERLKPLFELMREEKK